MCFFLSILSSQGEYWIPSAKLTSSLPLWWFSLRRGSIVSSSDKKMYLHHRKPGNSMIQRTWVLCSINEIIASIGSKFSFQQQTGGSVGFDVQFLKYFQVQPSLVFRPFQWHKCIFFWIRLQKKLLIHHDSFEVGLDVHTTKRSTKSAETYLTFT